MGQNREKSNIIMASMMAATVVLAVIVGIAGVYISRADNYDKAITAMKEEKYEEAADKLKELGIYKDSKEKLKECTYLQAGQLLSNHDFNEARKLYRELGDYEESGQMLVKCDYEEIMYDYSLDFFLTEKNT